MTRIPDPAASCSSSTISFCTFARFRFSVSISGTTAFRPTPSGPFPKYRSAVMKCFVCQGDQSNLKSVDVKTLNFGGVRGEGPHPSADAEFTMFGASLLTPPRTRPKVSKRLTHQSNVGRSTRRSNGASGPSRTGRSSRVFGPAPTE
jgi:hypothetical protein